MSSSKIQASPGSIFICYRREDSADVTGRIYDRLVGHFGQEHYVFMDVDSIKSGHDFRPQIDKTIEACSIAIVVIGDQWLAPVDGKRRIDDEDDRVRIEIEAALRRKTDYSHSDPACLSSYQGNVASKSGRFGLQTRHFNPPRAFPR